MARTHELVFALNGGGVDREGVSRIDLEKMRLAGEHPVANLLPRVVGPVRIRPGLRSIAPIEGNAVTRQVSFAKSASSGYIIRLSDELATICDGDGAPVAVLNPASTVLDSSFAGPLSGSYSTGWKNDSDTSAASLTSVTLSAGLYLQASRWHYASAQQQVAIAAPDQNTPHTLRIVVARGPVYLRLGTVADGQDLLAETQLIEGTHKITVTPGGASLFIKFRSEDYAQRIVTQCVFEHTALGGTGTLTLPTPWAEADLPYLAWDQSADVMFLGDGTKQQRRIERRGDASWSLTKYYTRSGPLDYPPLANKIALTPVGGYRGNIALSSSVAYFTPDMVGTLIEVTHLDQVVSETLDGLGQYTDYVTVTGVYSATATDRAFSVDITATGFTGRWVLERSFDKSIWSKVQTGTGATTIPFDDQLSNLTIYYRIRLTEWSAGYLGIGITRPGSTTVGLARITTYNSATSVDVEVINPFGDVTPSTAWRRQSWSDSLGWPRVPRFFDARLHWFRGDRDYASVVDDFDNYDDTVVGDSGPITRSVGSGAVADAQWALDLQRLIVGTTGYEASIRSSGFDEPLTPTAFTVRTASTQGSSVVPAVKIDRGAAFIQRSGTRLYEMYFSGETQDYTSRDLSRLNPTAFSSSVVSMAVQRQPDTRVYMVLSDGALIVLTYEPDDKVAAFTTITTEDGLFEDVAVIPGTVQDSVFVIVNRGGARYHEVFANELQQTAVTTCSLLDAHKVLTGSIATISGGTHLAGRTVQVWADGARRDDVTLNGSGTAVLGATYARVVYGLRYSGTFKSVKLAHAAQLGTALGQTKQVKGASMIMSNSCLDGVRVGRDATNTEPLPAIVNGAVRTASQFFDHYDQDIFPINSEWNPDARFYFSIDSAEGPATVQAIVLDIETRDGAGQNGK